MQSLSYKTLGLLNSIEEKARRVRTPAGARKYGQPIGTIITTDVVNAARAKRRGAKKPADTSVQNATAPKAPASSSSTPADKPAAKKPAASKGKKSMGEVYDEETAEQIKQYREFRDTKHKAMLTVKDINKMAKTKGMNLKPKSEADMELKWETSESGMKIVRMGGVVMAYNEEQRTLSGYYGKYRAMMEFLPRGAEADYNTVRTMALANMKVNKLIDAEPPKRIQREEAPFWSYWNGLRGIDWQREGETDADYSTITKKRERAMEESKRLDINVSSGIEPETHMVINSIVEAYKEQYPGFIDYNTGEFIETSRDTIASHGAPRTMRQGKYLGDRGKTAYTMHFNSKYFGNRKVKGKLLDEFMSSAKSGHFSADDLDVLAEKYSVKPEHVAAMHVIHHEFGHGVARWVFGEGDLTDKLRAQSDEAAANGTLLPNFGTDLSGDADSREAARMKYSKNITPILKKYGIFLDEGQLSDAINTGRHRGATSTTAARNDRAGGSSTALSNLSAFDTNKLSGHLSSYGATNIHEVMAESWAAYQLSDNPTEFVQEIGEAIEDMLAEFVEERDLEGRKPANSSKSLQTEIQQKLMNIYTKSLA